MSMFRRRLLMMAATPKSGLPAGWKKKEYVLTNIRQKEYFDTGVIPSRTTRVEMKVKFKDYPSAGLFVAFGSRKNEGDRFVMMTFGNRFRGEYASSILDLRTPISIANIYIAVKDGPDNYVDGTKLTSNTDGEINPALSLFLCAINDSGTVRDATGNYIYYCKIWENGEPVRDFIPVSDGTQEALYDLVTKTLFYKQSGPKTLDIGNEAEGGVE